MSSKEQYDQVKEWFDKDILEHEMTIQHDDGLFRHIRFAKPGTGIDYFNLTTFPNHLCISGDRGTYVFSRVEDMFRFFRNDRNTINPSYWGEKLESLSRLGGYKRFSVEEFQEQVTDWFKQYRYDAEDKELMDKIWADIKGRVIGPANDEGWGWEAMRSVLEYKYEEKYDDGFPVPDGIEVKNIFDDFGEHECSRYEGNYLWCLWAIIHGIKMYDEYTEINKKES